MKKRSVVLFVIYLVIGLYLINIGFGFVLIPEFIRAFDKWIILISGLLVIKGGIDYLRLKRKWLKEKMSKL